MLVLALALFLLLVIPASLLYLGKLIVASTDKRAYAAIKSREAALSSRAAERAPGEAPWYQRPMRPAFNKPADLD